jgi:hypothetical protein
VSICGAAHLELASAVTHLHSEEAIFDGMLRGWRASSCPGGLKEAIVADREAMGRAPGPSTRS